MNVFKHHRRFILLPVIWGFWLLTPAFSLASSLANPVSEWSKAPPVNLQSMRPVDWLLHANIEHRQIERKRDHPPRKPISYLVSDSPKAWLVYLEQQGLADNTVTIVDDSAMASEPDDCAEALISNPAGYSLPDRSIIHWNDTDADAIPLLSLGCSGPHTSHGVAIPLLIGPMPPPEDDEESKERHKVCYPDVPTHVKSTYCTFDGSEQDSMSGEKVETFKWQIDAQKLQTLKGNSLYSRPFYTFGNGYKFCLAVNWIFDREYDQENDQEYEQEYLNIALVPMKGEADKNRRWPVSVKIAYSVHNPAYSDILRWDFRKFHFEETGTLVQLATIYNRPLARVKLLTRGQTQWAIRHGELSLKANIALSYKDEADCITQ